MQLAGSSMHARAPSTALLRACSCSASSRQVLAAAPAAAAPPSASSRGGPQLRTAPHAQAARAAIVGSSRSSRVGSSSSGGSSRVHSKQCSSVIPRALKDEQAEIDRMAREADAPDIWSNQVVGTAVKVGIVAGVVAVLVVIGGLAKPMYDNTIKSFPTPAEYAQYEQREAEDEGGLGF